MIAIFMLHILKAVWQADGHFGLEGERLEVVSYNWNLWKLEVRNHATPSDVIEIREKLHARKCDMQGHSFQILVK